MTLISCWECKENISDQAPVCPHCGALPHTGTADGCLGILFLIAIFVGAALLLYFLFADRLLR